MIVYHLGTLAAYGDIPVAQLFAMTFVGSLEVAPGNALGPSLPFRNIGPD